jgi:hypothetical protein
MNTQLLEDCFIRVMLGPKPIDSHRKRPLREAWKFTRDAFLDAEWFAKYIRQTEAAQNDRSASGFYPCRPEQIERMRQAQQRAELLRQEFDMAMSGQLPEYWKQKSSAPGAQQFAKRFERLLSEPTNIKPAQLAFEEAA